MNDAFNFLIRIKKLSDIFNPIHPWQKISETSTKELHTRLVDFSLVSGQLNDKKGHKMNMRYGSNKD